MRVNVKQRSARRLQHAAVAIAAALASSGAYADAFGGSVVVPPAALPAAARDPGEAMFLHAAIDGRTLLYIEQEQGSRLATLDVTDPTRIKGGGHVELNAAEPFDFVAPLGDGAELVRFREGREEAVLDLPRVKKPSLRTIEGAPLERATIERATIERARPGRAAMLPALDAPTFESDNARVLNHAFAGKQVRAEATNVQTGTTFMLTDDGLYVIRRPAIESLHQFMVITPN